jgi:O-antigen/teichoic acid export membrane protein
VSRLDRFSGRLGAGVATIRRSAFMRSFFGVGGLTVAEIVLGLLTAILMARSLGVDGLGIYSLALAAVVLAGIPVEFGLPNLVMREIAHHDIDPESGAVKGMLIFAALVIVLMSIIVMPLTLVFGGGLVPGLGLAESAMLPVAVGLIPLSALGKTISTALAGKQMVVSGLIPQRLIRPGFFAVALGAAMLLEPGWLTPVRAMALQLTAATVALAVGALMFRRHFTGTLRRGPAVISWRIWTVAMLRLGVSTGIHLGQGQILLLITGALAGAENAGLLRIAQRAAGLVGIGTTIAYVASAPHIARLNAEGQHDRLQGLLTLVARASGGVAALALISFVFGGDWLLDTLFGADFAAALSAIVILGAAETARALIGPGIILMMMARREGIAAVGFVISLVVGTLIAWALIPTYGADGAAWGSFFGATVMAMFLWYKSRRVLFLDPSAFGWPVRRAESRYPA